MRKQYNQKLGGISARMSKPLPVAKVADEYSAEEQMLFREQFAPVVQRYRRRNRHRIVCVVGYCIWLGFPVIIAISGYSLSKDIIRAWFVVALSLGLALIVFGLSLPRLECPACHNRLDRRLGHYCPKCGSSQLEPEHWYRTPRCNDCGKRMARGKHGRCYRIRACTHCGVILDEIGL
jgi:hypothetical protein